MNNKRNNGLEPSVKELLKKSGNKGMTYGELSLKIGKTRKQKQSLSEALKSLLMSGVILKERKRFHLQEKQKEEVPRQRPAIRQHLIEGKFDATPLSRDRSFAFVRTENRDYYIDSEDTLNAFHNDLVQISTKSGGSFGDRAVVNKIIERANEHIPGTVSKYGNRFIFIPNNPKIHKWFEVCDIADAKPGLMVMLTVQNWGNPSDGKLPYGKITESIGPADDPEVQLLAVIRQYNLPLTFPDKVIEEAKRIDARIDKASIKNRLDLRKQLVFTIDPESAKDFDDAIAIEVKAEITILWVHIADVSHYVPIDSEIYKEAAQRGNSFYFPKKVIPMLPEAISNNICSLRPHEDKLCLSVQTVFNPKGKILKQSMHETLIRSKYRLSYEQVDDLFEDRETDLPQELINALNIARELSAMLSKIRLRQGYIFFDLPEIQYHYDSDGFMRRMDISEETESHKLIENFMLVANEFVAGELAKKSPISIYRIHENPDQNKIDSMANILEHYGISYVDRGNINKNIQAVLRSLPNKDYHRVFNRIILRSMKKAKYSTLHIRHFGLSMEDYTHFTSPIRRLCDLAVHHLCKIHITGSSKEKISREQLKHWASVASEQELEADSAERDIQIVYNTVFMKDKVGEHFSGLVISTNSSGLIVSLNEIPVNAVLKKEDFGAGKWNYIHDEMRFVNSNTGYYYELMDKVQVQITEVSDDIYLRLRKTKDAHQHSERLRPAKRKISIDAKAKPKKSDYKRKLKRKKRK